MGKKRMAKTAIEQTLFSPEQESETESAETPIPDDPKLSSLQEHLAAKAAVLSQRQRLREKDIERPDGFDHKDGIKSRERVQSIAEVLTPEREINAMLDLVDESVRNPRSRVLEPACGNGNFLEEILARKLRTVVAAAHNQNEFEFDVLTALSNTYGIDINDDNVNEARSRLRALVVHAYSTARNTNKPRPGFYESVDYILGTNIILGDSWRGSDMVVMVEYSSPFPDKFTRRFFTFAELERRDESKRVIPKPFKVIAATHFLELANAD
jgi:hypothetical protein